MNEIQHPSVRAVLQFLQVNKGLEIHHDGDLPARSGMGSSSSFTVGFLNAMCALLGQMPSKHKLAMDAIHIEQNILKETVGSQDQVLVAHGGFNHVTFGKDGDISLRPVTVSPERLLELNSHLMLFYSCIKRTASSIADSYVNDLENRRRQMLTMGGMVDEALTILTSGDDIKRFGTLLDEFWRLKRSLSNMVSNPEVDALYQAAREAGALGGKLTGAGGGGFLLAFVEPKNQARVREALRNTIYVPFKFEFQGSHIIFLDRESQCLEKYKELDDHSPKVFRELV